MPLVDWSKLKDFVSSQQIEIIHTSQPNESPRASSTFVRFCGLQNEPWLRTNRFRELDVVNKFWWLFRSISISDKIQSILLLILFLWVIESDLVSSIRPPFWKLEKALGLSVLIWPIILYFRTSQWIEPPPSFISSCMWAVVVKWEKVSSLDSFTEHIWLSSAILEKEKVTDLFLVGSVKTQVGTIALLGDLGQLQVFTIWRSRCLKFETSIRWTVDLSFLARF